MKTNEEIFSILEKNPIWKRYGYSANILRLTQQDGRKWLYLFTLALREQTAIAIDLVSILCILRAHGCYLSQNQKGWEIRHQIGANFFETEEDYTVVRNYLLQYKGWVISALKKVDKI